MKVFAGRPRDLEDVRGVIVRRGNALERAIVLDELAELEALSERRGLVDCFQRLCDQPWP